MCEAFFDTQYYMYLDLLARYVVDLQQCNFEHLALGTTGRSTGLPVIEDAKTESIRRRSML